MENNSYLTALHDRFLRFGIDSFCSQFDSNNSSSKLTCNAHLHMLCLITFVLWWNTSILIKPLVYSSLCASVVFFQQHSFSTISNSNLKVMPIIIHSCGLKNRQMHLLFVATKKKQPQLSVNCLKHFCLLSTLNILHNSVFCPLIFCLSLTCPLFFLLSQWTDKDTNELLHYTKHLYTCLTSTTLF